MKSRESQNWSLVEAAHLLNRAGFGGPPEEIRAIHALGPQKAVAQLLAGQKVEPDPFPPPAWATPEVYREQMEKFRDMRMEMRPMPRRSGAPEAPAANPDKQSGQKPDKPEMDPKAEGDAAPAANPEATAREANRMKLQKMMRQENQEQTVEMTRWWFRRMLAGPHPLQEKMTLFWHGHFATSTEKVRSAYLMYRQNALFRKKGLGSFGDLTKAVARDPAMMLYLDVQQSRRQMPNENFARELMELFTLGEGHYTEADIKESARAFTGMRFNRLDGQFHFTRYDHDDGEKKFLGKTGKFGADDIVDILLAQPACSDFLARKLWRFFVNDAPTDAEVAELSRTLRDENFHLDATLARLFRSSAFYDPKNIRAGIKSPVVFLAQLARQLGLKDVPGPVLFGGMREMGQQLFLPPNVAGWPGGAAWITTNTLFARYNMAGVLVRGGDPDFSILGLKGMEKLKARPMAAKGARGLAERIRRDWPKPDYAAIAPADLRKSPDQLVDQLVFRLFQHPLRPEDRESFLAFARKECEGGMADTEVGQLVHLMMSTPSYQLT